MPHATSFGLDWPTTRTPREKKPVASSGRRSHTEQMTAQRRGLNDAVTRVWSFLAPAYDLPFLQQWVYRPATRRGDRAAARPQLSENR